MQDDSNRQRFTENLRQLVLTTRMHDTAQDNEIDEVQTRADGFVLGCIRGRMMATTCYHRAQARFTT